MTSFVAPFSVDAVTMATPLTAMKHGGLHGPAGIGVRTIDLFLGKRGGCIGEVCIVALLAGAALVLALRYINWRIPVSFIATVGLLSWVFGSHGFFTGDWIFALLTGGLVLGAFFMATDYVSGPLTGKAKIVFGVGCGILTFAIRRYGGYPEGVSYSILIMNATAALLDRLMRPRIYGRHKPARALKAVL
jgi:electron transport complex protein RnfD